MGQRTREDRVAVAGWSLRQGPGSGQMGVVLTQGCPAPEGHAQSGQQGSRPSHSVHRAWELDPEQLTMEQGQQGGGKEGETTGLQTPKLSTKNGRFEPYECCPWGSGKGQMGKATGPPREGAGPQRLLHTEISILSYHMSLCLKRTPSKNVSENL